MRKHVNKKSDKGELKTKKITEVHFLLIRVNMPKDFLIVKNLYSGDLLFSSPDPLFLHLLSALGPSRLTYRGHTDSSHSLCLHLGLSNGEHQRKVEGALEIGAAALSSLAIFLQECHRLILFLP